VEEYDHPLWKKYGDIAVQTGHGGSDYLCMRDFVEAYVTKLPFPLMCTMRQLGALSTKLTEESVLNKATGRLPGFTRSKWRERNHCP